MLWAVVPAKDPTLAKSRLAPVVSQEYRAALSFAALDRVLEAIAGSPHIERLLVVSSAPSVRERAARFGAAHMLEQRALQASSGRPGEDEPLNRAIASAISFAAREGASAVLVVAGDLPLADVASVDMLVAAARAPGLVIVPDRHQVGTNALLLSPSGAIDVAFGHDSYKRHRARARTSGVAVTVCEDARLSLDIDTPDDLHELRARLRGFIAGAEDPKPSDVDLLALVNDALLNGRPNEMAACGRRNL